MMTPNIEDVMREIARAVVREELSSSPAATDDWLTTSQVAELTGLSTSYFNAGRSQGDTTQPPHVNIGRAVRYKRSDVLSWMESRPKRGVA